MHCTFCKAELKKGDVNHIVDLGNGIVIIKNVPANVCRQCGEYYVDTSTALKLESIIDKAKANKAEIIIINFDELVA